MTKGGPGSGNWGHSGRPGQVGGSGGAGFRADTAEAKRAGTIGGFKKTVDVNGEKHETMTVFYQPTLSIGGNPSSISVLLGDWVNYKGQSGNARVIDPKGKHLLVQDKKGTVHKVKVDSPQKTWAELKDSEE